MLTAEDKIKELQGLVQELRSEKHHLSMSLESEQNDKSDLVRAQLGFGTTRLESCESV